MTRSTPTFLLFLALAGGCTPGVQFKDDFDFRLDLRGAGGRDRLATPYVEGTPVRLTVTAWRDVTQLNFTSTDAEVFQIDQVVRSSDEVTLECTAMGPGTAEIEVTKLSGKLVDTVPIEVGRPDRAELHGPAVLSQGAEDRAVERPVLLRDGEATFEVRYFDGEQQLFGNEVVSIDADPGLSVTTDATYLFENREWVTIVADPACDSTPCEASLGISVAGQLLDSPVVEVVEVEDIDAIRLDAPDESVAEDEDLLTVVARAQTAAGDEVFGVAFEWTHDTLPEDGTGDLFQYTFDSSRQALPLEAAFGEHVASTAIRGQGSVGTSNSTGCSSVGTMGSVFGLGAVLPLLGLRRRQSRGLSMPKTR